MTTKIIERRRDYRPPYDKAKNRLFSIFVHTAVGIALVDRNGCIVESNPALQQMTGYVAAELHGQRFYELVQPLEIDSVFASLPDMFPGPTREAHTEARFVQKSGRVMWARLTVSPLDDYDDDPVCAVIILEDISAPKYAEEALRLSEFRFHALFESNIAPLNVWHADGRILDANDAYLNLIGCSRQELRAGTLRWDTLTASEYRHLDQQAREELTSHRRLFAINEKELLLRDGRRLPVVTSMSLLPGHDDCGFGCVIDLTEQKTALRRSDENKALIKAVFSSLTGYVAVIDGAGTVLLVNEAWVHFARENEGHPLAVAAHMNYLDMCRDASNRGDGNAEKAQDGIRSVLTGERAEFRMEYPSGKRWLEMIVQPLRRPEGGAIISHIDITDRRAADIEARNMRLELSHFARVAMMGELTASLAHELSQPLTAILFNAQAAQRLLTSSLPDLAELREILDDIVADEKRAGETIRRVRNLLKKSTPEHQLLDINAVIVEVLGFTNTEALTKHVVVTSQLAPNLPEVRGDRVQLQQVLLNLFLNALDAMKDVPVDERHLDVSSVQLEGAVQISVRDSGTGIVPDVLEKMFDPFFTAKPDGLGMGLAICRSIVETHGGHIWAASDVGRGAIFRFNLPIRVESLHHAR